MVSAKFSACHGMDYTGQFGCTKATTMGTCYQIDVKSDIEVDEKGAPTPYYRSRIHLPFENGTIQDKASPYFFPKITTTPRALERYISNGTEAERKLATWVKKATALAISVTDPNLKRKCRRTTKREFISLYG